MYQWSSEGQTSLDHWSNKGRPSVAQCPLSLFYSLSPLPLLAALSMLLLLSTLPLLQPYPLKIELSRRDVSFFPSPSSILIQNRNHFKTPFDWLY